MKFLFESQKERKAYPFHEEGEDNSESMLRKLSSVVEQTADTVMITDKAGRLEYVNRAFVETTGYTKEEALGQSTNILRSGKHSKAFYQELWTTILSGRPFQATMTNRKKNGELFYTEKTITPLLNNEGEITHFVSTDKNITDRRLAEENLLNLQSRLRGLFHSSPDPMAYCALDGEILEANEAFSKFTGYSNEELESKMKYRDVANPAYWENTNKALKHILETGESCTYEKEYRRKDGTLIPVFVTAFPVKNGHEIVAIGKIVKDITLLKQQQRQLERATEELSRSNAELEQFASIASHELQEPLRTISTCLQLIEKEYPPHKHFRFAVEACKRLSELIYDLLSYSRVGTERARFEEFESSKAVNEAIANLTESIAAEGAQIKIASLPRLYGDARRTTQLFQNLIGNAIKYHSKEPALIQIDASRRKDEWLFKVSDNGIGIPPDCRKKIFEMFQRLHGRDKFPGTGVGLAICKKIVELRGGKIWVESNEKGGSDFYFSVPNLAPV